MEMTLDEALKFAKEKQERLVKNEESPWNGIDL